ncbi:CYTH and CHAD domain-containing protein [Arthrobacter sp. ERGS1:01]|uniref:CYTH and CHAD domain-containing protein n=1 Tax=Arthrobacter sp. ERGS1:01 TaxID=1704044 RepID=UPI0009E80B95|nr:CYTH and CHAD domain-containing protein [Arthrobacter sp. ERGS1:01]
MDLPNLVDMPGVERVGGPGLNRIATVYFDTATLTLAARGITLCRRTGGTDHGWHLELPAGGHRTRRIQAPLGSSDIVPEELLYRVLPFIRGAVLMPVARIDTGRCTRRLYGPGGGHLADFVDDRVQAVAVRPGTPETAWREWRIELVHGNGDFLGEAASTLTSAGLNRPVQDSELARALGDSYPSGRVSGAGTPTGNGSALDVVTAYLDRQLGEILALDPGVRMGSPDAIHRMRSATRRERSVLTAYGSLFAKNETNRLKAELKWLAKILGRPRDAEVMRERLRCRLQGLPPALRNGTVTGPVEDELGTSYNVGYKAVLQALETLRYYRLLDNLEQFLRLPPAKSRASQPARKATAGLVNKQAKRLDRAHRAAARAKNGGAGDAALHQVRKDAKRLQHAAESVQGIHGKRARKLSKAAHRFQKILGDHQDSVVVRAFLDGLTNNPATPEIALTAYRRVRRAEERAAHSAKKKYLKARKRSSGLRLPH